jgi:hypothetical protein
MKKDRNLTRTNFLMRQILAGHDAIDPDFRLAIDGNNLIG